MTSRARPRVVQWATGAVGKTCLREVIDHPGLDLVGLLVYSDRKAGRDAGEIARRAPTGVLATRDRDVILDLDADIVLHTPRLALPYSAHDDDLCALLRSGKNVITTVGHHFPAAHGPERSDRFTEACLAGGTTLFGVGISPGVIGERLALALTGICCDVDRVEIDEVLDASGMPDPDFVFGVMGMGGDPEQVLATAEEGLPALFGSLYAETIAFLLERMGLRADRVEPDHRVLPALRDLDVAAGRIRQGTVVATEWRWHAVVDGARFLSLAIIWTMDPDLPDYRGRDHWTVRVSGRPGVTMTINLVEPSEPGRRTTAGQYATAAPVMHAIRPVLDAPPGLLHLPVFGSWTGPVGPRKATPR